MNDRVVLHPCKVRDRTLVIDRKREPEVFGWDGLLERLCPSGLVADGLKLRSIRQGAFVGLVRSSKDPKLVVNFLLMNPDLSGRIDSVLKRDPTFEQRLIEAYRVEEVVWAGVMEEQGGNRN